jgi:hypothetical protein
MLACVGVTLGFKNTLQIGNAYGKYYLKLNIDASFNFEAGYQI